MNLPEEFVERIKLQLQDEADKFFESYESPSYKGLRINMLKKSLAGCVPTPANFSFELIPVPWAEGGYYYDGKDEPGKHPFHEAGLYYIQEPSAMSAVPNLEVKPGETVLDLCASPGGKTTQIASYMDSRGLLVANEIVPKRARILSENVERMGVKNAIVLNESPDRLADRFFEYFDKILVDAPCSGEGMFRKNPEAIEEWSPDNVKLCAQRQDTILESAYTMLKTGGRMVYSTCTFSPDEDEKCMERFKKAHPDMIILKEHKIWPHKQKGEGHFFAVLTKGEENVIPSFATDTNNKLMSDKELKDYYDFLKDNIKNPDDYRGNIILFKESLYKLPQNAPSLSGLKVERPGLCLGTLKKNRFEPSHSLAMAMSPSEAKRFVNIDSEDTKAQDYLKGMTFEGGDNNGWHLVCFDGFSAGWAKCAGGVMKNHYPKGLRK